MEIRKDRETAGPAEPVTSIVEIAFAPMEHAVPVAAIGGLILLEDLVSGVQFVQRIKDSAPDFRKPPGVGDLVIAGQVGIGQFSELPRKRAEKRLLGLQFGQKLRMGEDFIDKIRKMAHGGILREEGGDETMEIA
jgi:hypothetical protein